MRSCKQLCKKCQVETRENAFPFTNDLSIFQTRHLSITYIRTRFPFTRVSHFPLHLDSPSLVSFSLSFIAPPFTRQTINPRPINQRPFLAGTFWQGNWELFGKRRRREPKNHEVRAFCHAALSFNPCPKRAAGLARFYLSRIRGISPRPRNSVARSSRRNFRPEIFSRSINRACGK